MNIATWLKRYCFVGSLLLACAANVAAQPLDDVSLEYQSGGIVATIQMTAPIQYLRHFPEKSGKTLEIFFDRAQDAAGSEGWVDNETRNSPPSGLIPSFTVTTRDVLSKPRLVIEFAREAEFSVAPGKDNRSLRITIRPDKVAKSDVALPFLPEIRAEAAAVAGAAASEADLNLAANNAQARALLVQAREALAAESNEAAVDAFNKLLMLPPNDYTQDGQEWVGVARERAGQIDKARTEYDLYLRLYPQGEGVARVMQRLQAMYSQGKTQAVAAPVEEKKKDGRWINTASISSHYYVSRYNSDTTETYNTVPSTLSQSMTDTSMLITSEDASMRYVSDEYDGRVVFRAVNNSNFIAGQASSNRINAAYGEIKNRKQNYMLRAGRQSASGGGVMGRFDGLYGSYGSQESRLNAVAGQLADNSKSSKPTFFGASYDMGAYSFYGIDQSVDGGADRRALGVEWRYFENNNTMFASVDYDAYFGELNAANMMGTLSMTGMNVNFMLDHRKAPFLSIRNALIGATTYSVNDLRLAMSESSLRDLALARTATSDMAQLGATIPFMEKWQVGGDLRLSNTTALPSSGRPTPTTGPNAGIPYIEGYIEALPGNGVEKGVSAQIVGSSIKKAGDIWSASSSLTSSSVVNSQTLSLSHHAPVSEKWMMDSMLQLSRRTDQKGGVTRYLAPTLRVTYNFRDNLTFDADCGVARTYSDGATSSTVTTTFSSSAGLRWDF